MEYVNSFSILNYFCLESDTETAHYIQETELPSLVAAIDHPVTDIAHCHKSQKIELLCPVAVIGHICHTCLQLTTYCFLSPTYFYWRRVCQVEVTRHKK
jgi:hypothetical protein